MIQQLDWAAVLKASRAATATGTSGSLTELEASHRLSSVAPHIQALVPREKLLLQTSYFVCPSWAAITPFADAHVEVRKNDVAVETLSLVRYPYFILGSSRQLCDFKQDHGSISNVHCALVFHGAKECFYVVDLDSKYGVSIDGTKIEKGKAVSLNFGSALRLGASTRRLVIRKTAPRIIVAARRQPANADLTVPVPHRFPDVVAPEVQAVSSSSVTLHAVPPASDEVHEGDEDRPSTIVRKFRHLLVKHNSVENAVSRAPRNKGEAVTRSKDDAWDFAVSLRVQMISLSSSNNNIAGGLVKTEVFVDFVSRFSECSTAKKGGDLGEIIKGEMSIEFDGAAFALLPGSVSRPVATELGVHLIFRYPQD